MTVTAPYSAESSISPGRTLASVPGDFAFIDFFPKRQLIFFLGDSKHFKAYKEGRLNGGLCAYSGCYLLNRFAHSAPLITSVLCPIARAAAWASS